LAEDLLLPDFCSGAAGLSGRFTEGFFHRRSHSEMSGNRRTEWWMTQSAANRYPVYIHTVVYKLAVV
jgi:hypothetical protein